MSLTAAEALHPLWDAVAPAIITGTSVLTAAYLAWRGVDRTVAAQRRAAEQTLMQRWEADRQAAWWSRVEFALTQVVQENDLAAVLGLATLVELQKRPAADGDELILRQIMVLLKDGPDEHNLAAAPARAQTATETGK